MLESVINFLTKIQVEDQVHPGVDVANIFIMFVLLFTFAVAFVEYRANRRRELSERENERNRYDREQKISREMSARSMYRDYLKVALANPDLSIAKYNPDDPIEADKYDTFLSIMLFAFDEAVTYTEESEFYEATIKWQISVHQDYLREILHKDVPEDDSFRSAYSARFLKYVDKAFAEIDAGNGMTIERNV